MTDLPTPPQIRKARKAELVAWCEAFGLDVEGKVDDLRARLLEHVRAAAEAPTAAPEKAPPRPKKEGEVAKPPPEEEPAEEAEEEEAPKARRKPKEEKEPEEAYAPKQKPQIDSTTRELLRLRREIAARRPRFYRQEWFRDARLGQKWRKPTGGQSKLRRHLGYRINVVSIGYRGPKAVRGLHPSGFREVLVHKVRDLEAIDPKLEAARIAGTVGGRRRTEIEAAADEKGIRVLNRRAEG